MLTLYVYLWGVSESLSQLFAWGSFLFGVGFAVRYIIYLGAVYLTDRNDLRTLREILKRDPMPDDVVKYFKRLRPGWIHTPLFILTLLGSVLIPDKQTIALMYILPQVQKVMPSPETVSVEGREMYDYVKAWMKAELEKRAAEAKRDLPAVSTSTAVPDNQSR